MIEDALKTTRNTERLLLAVSIVALLFVLSVNVTHQEQQLLDEIQRLTTLANEDYGAYVEERVAKEFEKDPVDFGSDELEAELADVGLQILGVSQVTDRVSEPAHVGRLLPEQLPFGDDDITLAELDRLFGRAPFDRDVQVATLKFSEVRQALVEFLDSSVRDSALGTRGARIEDVRLDPVTGTSEIVDTFLPTPSDSALLHLQFELHTDAGSIPIFGETFTGTIETLPDSSYFDWLSTQDELDKLAGQVDEEWRWLPDRGLTEKERNVPLPKLQETLAREIDEAKASNQVIRLPGVSVPGKLALVAIPVAFIGLVWIYLSHLRHLHGLVEGHREAFWEFAWLPLSDRSGLWWLMASIPALVLPLMVFGLLAWRVSAFDLPRALGLGLCVAGAVVVGWLGFRCLRWLERIRRAVGTRGESH